MGKGNALPESWGTESGLPDDFDMLIETAWYGNNEESERDPDKVYLLFNGPATIDGEILDEEEGTTVLYPAGKNWEITKGGKAVEHANGATKFNEATGVGHLINAITALAEEDSDFMDALNEAGPPTVAASFLNMNLHFERRVVSTFKDEDGEDVEWSLPLPVGFNGMGEAAEAAPAKKASSKSTKKDKDSDKGSDDGDLRAAVIEFAQKFDADEHTEFVEEVLDADVFDQAEDIDEELRAQILDDGSKLWRKAHR